MARVYFCAFSLRAKIMHETTCAISVLSKRSLSTIPNDKQNQHVNTGGYKDAIQALNNLQSNSVTVQASISKQINHLDDTRKYLSRSGITPEILDKLSVIHVSGSKGKGSTCALCESILSSFGLKTGFFSSPHLVSVTERFRICGKPISENDFTRVFWKIYNLLNSQKEHENDMPAYFKFLTILGFHLFLEENVDVAIIEVGIGGEKDCTNVLRNTKTVGITSLGLEHTALLGDTLSEIARQKAGIIKPYSNVFTVPQPEECLKVIRDVARERNAKLHIVPSLTEYNLTKLPKLQIQSKAQNLNASLAIQLAYDWIQQNKIYRLNGLINKLNESNLILNCSQEVVNGLEQCFWPGRCQSLKVDNMYIYLDGAHTVESIDVCIDWFTGIVQNSTRPKCLIFNTTGDRNAEKLLRLINEEVNFNVALFVPNIPYQNAGEDYSDIVSWSSGDQVQRAAKHAQIWDNLKGDSSAKSFNCIFDSLVYLDKHYGNTEIDVLFTGSIQLIGTVLIALDKYKNYKK